MASYQIIEKLGFPVFCITFLPNQSTCVVGGGGGATKAGVKNTILLFQIDEQKGIIKQIAEHLFSKVDDGCMSVGIHPKVSGIVNHLVFNFFFSFSIRNTFSLIE
jgi:hypothetical protein